MFQDDIFKLLMGCLLIANNNGGCGCNDSYDKLNEIIILSMLMNTNCHPHHKCCPSNNSCSNDIEPLNSSLNNNNRCNCGCGCN